MSEAFKKFDLTGKTALVTGGATGLGYAMSRGLLRSGATVMMAARREDILDRAAARLRSETGTNQILYRHADLSQQDSIEALADHAATTMGGVDIFVGNAGQDLFEPVDKISSAVMEQMLQVNLASNIQLVRALLPGMRKKKWGRIIFSSSMSSERSSPHEGMALYALTKAALNSLARTVAVEAGHDGITANSLVLGMFETEMLTEVLKHLESAQGKEGVKAFTDSFAGMTALGRFGRVDEVESLVQFVASDAASYLTGASLVFDGGSTIMLRPNPPPQ